MGKKIEIKFSIEDIPCPGCAMDIEDIMLGMEGIDDATVNFTTGQLFILYNPEKITATFIAEKVKKLGLKTKMLPG